MSNGRPADFAAATFPIPSDHGGGGGATGPTGPTGPFPALAAAELVYGATGGGVGQDAHAVRITGSQPAVPALPGAAGGVVFDAIVVGFDGTIANILSAASLFIQPQATHAAGANAGDVSIQGGNTLTGTGANALFKGGDANAGNGVGGVATIQGGNGFGAGRGGVVFVEGGVSGTTAQGAAVIINGADGGTTNGDGGGVSINGGIALGGNSAGGDVEITSGDGAGTGNAGHILLAGGTSATVAGGNITLSMGTGTPNGSLILANATIANGATAGANGDVPAQVVGYLEVIINGTLRKIPFYAN